EGLARPIRLVVQTISGDRNRAAALEIAAYPGRRNGEVAPAKHLRKETAGALRSGPDRLPDGHGDWRRGGHRCGPTAQPEVRTRAKAQGKPAGRAGRVRARGQGRGRSGFSREGP